MRPASFQFGDRHDVNIITRIPLNHQRIVRRCSRIVWYGLQGRVYSSRRCAQLGSPFPSDVPFLLSTYAMEPLPHGVLILAYTTITRAGMRVGIHRPAILSASHTPQLYPR